MSIDPTADSDLPDWFHAVPPLFVVGCPRSGTTWIQRMLLELPGIVGGPESHFFAAFGPALRQFDEIRTPTRDIGLSAYMTRDAVVGELRRLWILTQGPLVEQDAGARVLLEKTPGHARFAAEIREVLPNARFLHVIRDGRAVAASLKAASTSFGEAWAPPRATTAIRMWMGHVRDARGARDIFGDEHYLEVRYEDALAAPKETLVQLARFAGLEPTDDAIRRAVETHDAKAIRSGKGHEIWRTEPEGFFRKATSDGWKQELGLVERIKIRHYAGDMLRSLGYR